MKHANFKAMMAVLALGTVPAAFAADVIIDDPDPALVFEDNTDGFGDGYEWVIRGRDEYFSIDAEVVGDQIFLIEPSGPADRDRSIVVGTHGQVDFIDQMVTLDPAGAMYMNASIHMETMDAGIFVTNYALEPAPRTLFKIENLGNTKFEIREQMTDTTWAFTNSGQDFRMSLQDSGVVEFRVDNNGDAYLAGLLFENSDRNAKTDFEDIDPEQVLDTVLDIPVMRWSYKESTDIRHMGPMAQDFRAAFGLGLNERSIAAIDLGGASLAAVQGLAARHERRAAALEASLATLTTTLAERDVEVRTLKERLAGLEAQQARLVTWVLHSGGAPRQVAVSTPQP